MAFNTVHVVPREHVTAYLRGLAGLSETDIARRKLRRAEIRIDEALKVLTDPNGPFYGSPFWMPAAAEWLLEAEQDAAKLRPIVEADDAQRRARVKGRSPT